MERRNQILAVILLLQVALVGFVFWPANRGAASAAALLTDVKLEDVNSVTIQDSGDNAKTLKVTRAGDSWVLSSAADYPVDTVKATDLISKVLSINTRQLVAQSDTSHKRLEVAADKFQRRIDLELKDGKTQTLFIGSSPNARSTNVRRDGSEAVYITDKLGAFDVHTDIASWIDTAYFKSVQSDMQRVMVENAQGKLEFTEISTDTWTLQGLAAGEIFNQNNLTSLLTRLENVPMIEPLGKEAKPDFGMETPSATVTIVSQAPGGQSQTRSLVVGAKEATADNYFMKASDSDYYVKVSGFTVEQMIKRGRSDYLQPPPTPAATDTITATNFISSFVPLTDTAGMSQVVTATDSISGSVSLTDSGTISATETVSGTQ